MFEGKVSHHHPHAIKDEMRNLFSAVQSLCSPRARFKRPCFQPCDACTRKSQRQKKRRTGACNDLVESIYNWNKDANQNDHGMFALKMNIGMPIIESL